MRELKLILSREQPRINLELQKRVDELPPGSRAVAAHLLAAGGKRLRPLLTLLTGRVLGCREQALYTLGAAVEILHAATLLHDDILDNAALRRNKPAAHMVFPTTQVVLTGDAMLATALMMVSGLGDARLTACISEAVLRTVEGEMGEFAALRDTAMPHEGYLAVITGKTAWMLRASCELGALYAGAPQGQVKAAADFGLELGVAFQMVDDALDFSPAKVTGKPSGGDLREGKITPPLLFYIKTLPEEEQGRFQRKFRDNSFTENELNGISLSIYQDGHAEATRELAGKHLDRAASALRLLPETPERGLLEKMSLYIRQRKQ